MYHTGLDPRTMKPVYVAKTYEEKLEQRALMQFSYPKNYAIVRRALIKAHREDLIGNGPKCLIPSRPPKGSEGGRRSGGQRRRPNSGKRT